MGMGNYLEMAIILVILGGFAAVFWKGGASNPVGTGALQNKMRKISQDLREMGDGYQRISQDVEALRGSAASSDDIARIQSDLEAEKTRTDKLFVTLEVVSTDIHALRKENATKNQVIDSLSKGVRTIAAQLQDHRDDVSHRLDALGAMSERIEANRRAIDAIATQLPDIRATQGKLVETVSATASDMKIVGRQVDRLYDVIVTKGMN